MPDTFVIEEDGGTPASIEAPGDTFLVEGGPTGPRGPRVAVIWSEAAPTPEDAEGRTVGDLWVVVDPL